MTDLNTAVDAFFAARPGWSRFNLEHCFRLGWANHLSGKPDQSGGFLANTTERVTYNAGQLAAADAIMVDETHAEHQSG
jgi:hypothetical protein